MTEEERQQVDDLLQSARQLPGDVLRWVGHQLVEPFTSPQVLALLVFMVILVVCMLVSGYA